MASCHVPPQPQITPTLPAWREACQHNATVRPSRPHLKGNRTPRRAAVCARLVLRLGQHLLQDRLVLCVQLWVLVPRCHGVALGRGRRPAAGVHASPHSQTPARSLENRKETPQRACKEKKTLRPRPYERQRPVVAPGRPGCDSGCECKGVNAADGAVCCAKMVAQRGLDNISVLVLKRLGTLNGHRNVTMPHTIYDKYMYSIS